MVEISINLDAVERFLHVGQEYPSTEEPKSKLGEVQQYTIDIVQTRNGTAFYHRYANQFSNAIAGSSLLLDQNYEWQELDGHICMTVDVGGEITDRRLLFAAPTSDANSLIAGQRPPRTINFPAEDIVQVQLDKVSFPIKCSTPIAQVVGYSNEVASLRYISEDGFVLY